MIIMQRIKGAVFLALAALLALSMFAGTSAEDRDNHDDRVNEIDWMAADAENITEAARFDVADAKGRFASGIPQPLLAALIGMPEDAMGWGGMARISLAPEAATPVLVGPSAILYVIEEGSLSVRSDATIRIVYAGAKHAQELALYGDAVTVQVGDQVLIGAGVSYSLAADGPDKSIALAASVLPRSATTASGFNNDGVTPRMPLSVSMFLAAADIAGSEATWPNGVTVTPLVAQEIIAGPQ